MTSSHGWLCSVRVETTVRETYEREAGRRKRAVTFKPDREIDSTDTWMFTDGGSKGWYGLVVLRPGRVASPDEIMAFVAGRLAHYKKVRAVEFVDAIPRNPSGKILRRVLKARA